MKYIIDGYNMLNNPLFKKYLMDSPEETAKSIVPFLIEEARVNFEIVFDGKFEPPPDLLKYIRMSGKTQDADSYIVNMLLREGVENKVVVTNDVHLQMRVRNIGGKAISVEEFYSRINRARKRRLGHSSKDTKGIDKKTQEEITRLLKKEFGVE